MPSFITVLRPHQWVKHAFVLAPMVFALQFDQLEAWRVSLLSVVVFICVSGAVYIFNDVMDVEADRAHPIRKTRPVARGALSIEQAMAEAMMLLAVGTLLLQLLPVGCAWVVVCYFLMNVAYSVKLKQVVILDVVVIATGFVLRVLMGGYALQVAISPWIIIWGAGFYALKLN